MIIRQENEMIIRQENEKEYNDIYELVKVGFETAKVSDGNEQNFVVELRKGEGYIPELALVAEENEQLIGHIMLTKYSVQTEKNKEEVLLLAPLTVALKYRGQGIGGKLIKESLKKAKEMGYTSVFLVGDPAYYSRYGFQPSVKFGIKNTNDIPDEYVMAQEIVEGSLQKIQGTITF